MGRIYFIRHGQASFGSRNYDCLSDTGREQSKVLGEYLSRIRKRFDFVYSGSLERQKETAEIVMSALENGISRTKIIRMPEFDEYDAHQVMKSWCYDLMEADPLAASQIDDLMADRKAFQKEFALAVERWMAGEYDRFGGESWDSFKERVKAGMESVRKRAGKGKDIALFSSAGVLSAFSQLALGLSDETTIALSWQIINASISVFIYDDHRFSLETLNSAGHLERPGDDRLITWR